MNDSTLHQFLRIIAVWPQLGGEDELAEQRASEWMRVMGKYDPDVAARATDEIIEDWAGAFPPGIGNWRDCARSVVRRRPAPVQRALPEPAPDPERIHALVTAAAERLRLEKAKASPLRVPDVPRGTRANPTRHMLTYDDLYGHNQEGNDYDDHDEAAPTRAAEAEACTDA